MATRRYTVVLVAEPQDGGYSVMVPALPGCFTQGETRDEALANAREAIHLDLQGVQADGEAIPDDVSPEVATVEVETVGVG